MTVPVIIVGGGIAGLSAASTLAKNGVKSIILDREETFLGGRLSGKPSISFSYQGKEYQFPSEHAVHGIWDQYHNFRELFAENNINIEYYESTEEGWIHSRKGRIREANVGSAIRRGFIPAPFHYLNLFLRYNFWKMLNIFDILSLPFVLFTLILAVGIDPLEEDQPLEDLVLSDLMKYWGPGVKAFMLGLAKNGLAAGPDDVPLSGFLAFLRFYTILGKNRWRFSYLSDPAGEVLIKPLSSELKKKGVEIHLSESVSSIAESEKGWEVKTNLSEYCADYLIIATDEQNARKLLSRTSLKKEKGVKTLVFRIWYSVSPNTKAEGGILSGDLMLDNYFWLNKIYDTYHQWEIETGGCVFEGHIYGPLDVVSQPDAVLAAKSIQEVERAFPILKGKRVHVDVQKNVDSHTLFAVGTTESHPTIDAVGNKVFLCGDWVRFNHPSLFLERATVSGIMAANFVLKELQYPEKQIIPTDPPEKLVSWIQKLIRIGRKIKLNGKKY
jgi:carotenoid phi-ring synthase / carotenoid chi-ring synthase